MISVAGFATPLTGPGGAGRDRLTNDRLSTFADIEADTGRQTGLVHIGDRVHYIPRFGHCAPARIVEIGGVLTQTVRGAAGQKVMETSGWSDQVVRLNVVDLDIKGCPHYWDADGDTTVVESWHRREECRAAARRGGRWVAEQVP